jgi:hypothetical protein
VERVLAAAGQGVDALRNVVEKFRRRAELQRQITEAADAERQAGAIQDRIDKADARLKQATEAHAAEVDPLRAQLSGLRNTIIRVGGARSELFQTCDDDGLRQELAAIQQEQNDIDREQRQLTDTRDRIAINIRTAETDAAHGYTARLDDARSRWTATGARLQELESRKAELAAEAERVTTAMVAV